MTITLFFCARFSGFFPEKQLHLPDGFVIIAGIVWIIVTICCAKGGGEHE
jgi:hypothetical protein